VSVTDGSGVRAGEEVTHRAAPRGHSSPPYKSIVENVTQSATACLVTMVQGNLLTLTLAHWLIASRTGLLSGTVATASIWLLGERRRWVVAAVLTATTIGADYLSHPGHFGGVVTEAVVTGLAAGALSPGGNLIRVT
jgi:hypothetical protein